MIIDMLLERIYDIESPLCAGLDPRIERIPHLLRESHSEEDAIFTFNKEIMDTIYDLIPCVKLQIAFYEFYRERGIKLFFDTAKYAKQKGFFVIADIKRGDIGDVASYYSKTYLGCQYIDGITINPYLGPSAITPFIEDAKMYDKMVFILAKTSNPESAFIQDLSVDGVPLYEKIAKLADDMGKPLRGRSGYSNIGIVVGATYPKELKALRERFPYLFFLVPGYGTQGGKLTDFPHGMLINVSRSLIYATEEGKDYKTVIRKRAIKILNEITKREKVA